MFLIGWKSTTKIWYFVKKSHTCEEGGAQLRISFWHLLMNLKIKYLSKKMLKWANKKQNNFNIYNAVFLKKKIKKNTWRYDYFKAVYQNSQWYDLQFLRYRAWQTEIGNFRSFFALLPHKNPNEISSFYTCVTKITIIYGSWDTKQDRIFCHLGPFFALLS